MAKKNILIVAGEPSGDLHAAGLVLSLKQLDSELIFSGLGGEKMRASGVELYYDLTSLAVIGIFEVLKNIIKFKKIFNDLLSRIDKNKPDLAILVDYPGFNLELAKELKKRNIPVVYYISPQVWAWGKERIKLIRQVVTKMLVIFKFEEELYKNNGVDAKFVGHPLLDIVKPTCTKEEFYKKFLIPNSDKLICLLPGSRNKEIKTLLPALLGASKIIKAKIPGSSFAIAKAPWIKKELFDRIIAENFKGLTIKLIESNNYDLINASDICLVASGTATLETAILARPMVIVYKISILTWLYLRFAIKIPYVGLVNVVAGKKIVPECLQFAATGENIARNALAILEDSQTYKSTIAELSKIKYLIQPSNASANAAREIYAILNPKT